MNFVDNFCFDGDTLLVHSNNSNKFVWFSFDGTVVKELSLHGLSRLAFELLLGAVLYGFKTDFLESKGPMEVMGLPNVLLALSPDGTSVKTLASFPVQTLAMRGAMVSATSLIAAPDKDNHLFVSHTQDYLVKLCDLRMGDVLRSFKRAYQRLKRPEGSRASAILIDGRTCEARPGPNISTMSPT